MLLYVAYAQSQGSCSTAITLANESAGPIYNQTAVSKWYKFTAKGSKIRFNLGSATIGADQVSTAILWSGSCGSLSKITSDSISSGSDYDLAFTNSSLTNGATYYIEIKKFNSIDTISYLMGLNFRLDITSCSECALPPSTTCELLCNGSFEYNLAIPNTVTLTNGNLEICGWENATNASPDYFTTQSYYPGVPSTWCVNIPNTFQGNQTARTGDAMAGFYAKTSAGGSPFAINGWHEYIYQTLDAPLTAGVTYTLSFYVKPSSGSTNYADSIGAWFTDYNGIFGPGGTIQGQIPGATPQIVETNFITDTTAWTLVTGTYTATGLEEFLVLGCFGSALSPTPSSTYESYYFLDDVSLSRAPMCNNITYDFTIPAGNVYTSALTGGYTPVTISNWNLYVTGNLYVDHDLTFSGCNIVMNSNSQIVLTNNAKLTLTDKTHIYGCCDMWDGIYVRQGSELYSLNNVIVEDANHAFVSQTIGSAYGGLIYVDSTLFNRCYTGIEIQQNTATTSPLFVIQSVFTSREIPTDVVIANNLSVLQYRANLLSYPSRNQKSHPYKGVNGVLATNVNYVGVGVEHIFTDGQEPNLFDNLYAGVNFQNSNGFVEYNKFQKMLTPIPTGCFMCDNPPNYPGYGVYAAGTINNSIVVGGIDPALINEYDDVHSSVYVDGYGYSLAYDNYITNSSTGPFGISTRGFGNRGIYIKPSGGNQNAYIALNSVNNCETAINVNRNFSTANPVNMVIDTNVVTASGSGYCTYGIYVQDYIYGNATPTTSEVNSNTITNARYGITFTFTRRTDVKFNSITTLNASSGVRYGIKTASASEIKITNNHTKYSDGLAAQSGGNIAAYGIYLSNSTNMLVKCNEVEDAGRSLVFEQTCTSPLTLSSTPTVGITQNTMRRAQDGFVLKSSGIIGTQGNGTYPSNNYWDLSATPNFLTSHTNADGSNANNSHLYMNNVTTGANATRPTVNTLGGAATAYLWNTSLLNSTGTPSACGYVPALMGGGEEEQEQMSSMSLSSNSNYENDLNAIITNSTVYDEYNDEIHWLQKNYVYNELANNQSLHSSNALLNNFYSANINSNHGKFERVNSNIALGQYVQAQNINNSVNATNSIEINQKALNHLILKKLINNAYEYTSKDSTELYEIAEQCAVYNGNAVHQARNVFMSIYNQLIEFEDDCEESKKEMIASNINENVITDTEVKYTLYPNPNNGHFIIEHPINTIGELLIYDVAGKLIFTYGINNASNQTFISSNGLDNGVYFYEIKTSNSVVKNSKLVIVK